MVAGNMITVVGSDSGQSPNVRTGRRSSCPLRPDCLSDGVFRIGGADVSGAGIGPPEFVVVVDTYEGAVDNGFEFAEILHFAALGQAALGFSGAHPRGMAVGLVGAAHLVNLHQKSLDHKFLHAAGLPEDSLGMYVQMKVARLDGPAGPGFFGRFAFGGLAVGEAGIGGSLGESPLVAAVGINQKELNRRAPPAIADRSDLKRQGLRNAG